MTTARGLRKSDCDRHGVGILWDPTSPGLGLRRQRQDGAATWVYRATVRGRKRQAVLGRYPDVSPGQARDLAALRRAEVVRRDPVAELRSQRVADIVEHWLEHHRTSRKGHAPRDVPDLVRHCGWIVQAWGGLRADEIRHTDVAALCSQRSGPYAANRLRATVRQVWNCARVWGFVSGPNPVTGSPVNRERARSVRALTPAEVGRLIDAAEQYPDAVARAAIVLLALTGARKSEILRLRVEDFDIAGRTVLLRDRKDGADMRLPLSERAVQIVAQCVRTSTWLLPGASGGPRKEIRSAWAWCCRAAGLPAGTRMHDVRAAVATIVAETVGLRAAQQVLGHADARTTLRYTRPGDAERRAGVDALDAALRKG